MAIEITRRNDFTTTVWCGENICRDFVFNKQLLSHKWIIQSPVHNFWQLISKINSQNNSEWSKGHRGNQVIINLRILWNHLWKNIWWDFIDPIEYFIQLYFWDWLSIQDIFARVNGKWFQYKDESWLRKIFTQTFEWQLKDTTELTEITKRKIEQTLNDKRENLREQSKMLEEQRKVKFETWYSLYAKENSNPDFDSEYFWSLKNKVLKIQYSLFIFCNIWNEQLQKLKESGLWTKVIAKYFEEIINKFLENQKIEKMKIVHTEIQKLLV